MLTEYMAGRIQAFSTIVAAATAVIFAWIYCFQYAFYRALGVSLANVGASAATHATTSLIVVAVIVGIAVLSPLLLNHWLIRQDVSTRKWTLAFVVALTGLGLASSAETFTAIGIFVLFLTSPVLIHTDQQQRRRTILPRGAAKAAKGLVVTGLAILLGFTINPFEVGLRAAADLNSEPWKSIREMAGVSLFCIEADTQRAIVAASPRLAEHLRAKRDIVALGAADGMTALYISDIKATYRISTTELVIEQRPC